MALIHQILVPIHRRSVSLWSGTPFESRQWTRANGIVDWQRLARAILRGCTFVPWYYSNLSYTVCFLVISFYLIARTRHNPCDYFAYLLADTSRNTRFSVMLDETSRTVPLLKQLPKFFPRATISVLCSSVGLKVRKQTLKDVFSVENIISKIFF